MPIPVRELLNRLRDRLHRDVLSRELDEELRFHKAMLEQNGRAGRHLGNVTYIKEEARAMWSLGWFDDLLQDVRYALRILRQNMAFTAAVVLTLALGIGANTAIFSVVNAVVLQPLPYKDADRLYSIWTIPVQSPADRNPISYPSLADWRKQNTVFTDIGGYVFNRYELTGTNGTDFVRGIAAMPNVYEILGATPLLGRLPRPDEAAVRVVAISYRLWRRRFGGDPSVIGAKTIMDEVPYTIVGVMAPGFHFPTPDIDVWISQSAIGTQPQGAVTNPWLTSRGLRGWRVVARLKPGVAARTAEVQMNEIMDRLGRAYPDADGGTDVALQSLRDDTVRGVQRALWLTLGAAGLVLLLACANVAHLMLARLSTRSRELAIRRALGAHRSRVVRQLLTESVLLGFVGGMCGVQVAVAGIRVLMRLSPGDIPRLENVALDPATLAFAAVVSLLTGIIFGVAPTLVAWRSGAGGDTLREHARADVGGHGSRVRSALTVAEVAFAMVLLVGAGLMIRSFATLLNTDLGFRPEDVTVFHVGFAPTRYPTATDKQAGLERVLDRLRAIPGVRSAGASTSMPPARMQQANGYIVEGDAPPKPGQEPQAIYVPVTPQFLTSLGVPLLAGRQIRPGDDARAPRVALISQELARRSFAGRDPIGRRFQVADSMWTIIGVVGDVNYQGIDKPVRPTIYVPWAQSSFGGSWIAVRSSIAPTSLLEPIRGAIHEIDPMMNPRELKPMETMIGESMVRPRFQTWLLATFGGLALMLAAIGIYGVIAYGVAQRTSEIGLRLALGAPPASVVRGIMRRGMTPVAAGLLLGLGGAYALSRVMTGLLYGVSATDAAAFAATAALLGLVALGAAFLPARRAARLDPLRALRDG